MKRQVKIVKADERKSTVPVAKGGKIPSRLERIEQAYRNVKGALGQLESLLAEEKKQAGN